jgi:hypothetical protein
VEPTLGVRRLAEGGGAGVKDMDFGGPVNRGYQVVFGRQLIIDATHATSKLPRSEEEEPWVCEHEGEIVSKCDIKISLNQESA